MEGPDRKPWTYDLLACVHACSSWFVRLLGANPSVQSHQHQEIVQPQEYERVGAS
jgi:hypothetical protein